MKRAIVMSLAMMLTACVTEPQTFDVKNSRQYTQSKERAWDHLIQFFALNNIQIKTIDKSSGVIYAERAIGRAPSGGKIGDMADCGVSPLFPPISQAIQMNVYVQDLGATASKATVTTTFTETRINALDGKPVAPVQCNSTGVLEGHVLDAMGG